MNLLIIRHAESANNRIAESTDYRTFVATRSADPPITGRGEAQAERLAIHLAESRHPEFSRREQRFERGYGITRLVCSPMLRTLQTAAPAARCLNLPLEVWPDIFEQGGVFDGDPQSEQGARTWPGLDRAEMQSKFPEAVLPAEITEHGWWLRGYEEMDECAARASVVAERLSVMAEAESQTVLVLVTHGTFINQLLHHLLGVPAHSMMYFFHANTGITRVEFAPDGYRVLRYVNRVPHLEGELMSR